MIQQMIQQMNCIAIRSTVPQLVNSGIHDRDMKVIQVWIHRLPTCSLE